MAKPKVENFSLAKTWCEMCGNPSLVHFFQNLVKHALPISKFFLTEKFYAVIPIADRKVSVPSPINFVREHNPARNCHRSCKMCKRSVITDYNI